LSKRKIYQTGMMALFCVLVFSCVPAYAFNLFGAKEDVAKKDIPVDVMADQLEYVKGENKVIGTGNVVVTYDTMQLTCDYAEVYTDSKQANAKGHVILSRENDVLRGDEGSYNFATDSGTFPGGEFINVPYYGTGDDLTQVNKDKITLENATLTTCDHIIDPRELTHYQVFAKSVTIYPNDKIIAKNVHIKILDKTVFWLPFIHVPLNDRKAPFHLHPGYSSEEGAYVLGSKRYSVSKDVSGKLHIDWRQKRGWGFGNDLDYSNALLGTGEGKFYIIDDKESPDQKSANPYDNRIENTRYRFSWKHKKTIGRTSFMAEINKFSDKFLLKDFFEKEYKNEVTPETYVNVTHNRDNFGVFVNVEKRINHFVDTLERLPEVRFNWNNQEIADTNVYYKNETSFNHFNKKIAHSSNDTDVSRFDTVHEVSYPVKIQQISIRPFANWRGNYYSKNAGGEENIYRQVIGGGAEATTKFYRIWDVQSNALGLDINKLRHILQPNIRYDSVRMRSVYPRELFQIDAIDAIDDKDVIKVGFDNRLQTKRFFGDQEKTVNIVSYNTYMTYAFKEETMGGSTFLTWENELEFRPYDWLMGKATSVYDVPNDEFRTFDLDIELRGGNKWNMYVQHKFLKEGSKQLTVHGTYKINDLWGLGGYMRFEFDERDVAEEWEIRATRDLHCWFLDFGYNVRNSDIDSANKEVFVELTLKAFPDYPLKSGNQASYSRARMGDTVSGANEYSRDNHAYELIRY
jgi:LPS-assembly protein